MIGKIVIDIAILLICSIGLVSIVRWVFSLFSKSRNQGKKYIRVGKEMVCYDDLPEANKYKGRTWLWGLPVYADIVYPNKRDYSTIIYMDHWFKQYVHDVMLNWGSSFPVWVFSLALMVLLNPLFVLTITGLVLLYLHLWAFPSATRGVREMGELFKNLTPEDWVKVDLDVIESIKREDEIVSAIQRSGLR